MGRNKSLCGSEAWGLQIKFRRRFHRNHGQCIGAEAPEQLRGTAEKIDFLAEQEGGQNNCRGEREPTHSPGLNRAYGSLQRLKNSFL